MQGFNSITICGHVASDPALKYTPQGTAICDFSIGTNNWKRGEEEAKTTWFRCSVFGKQAEKANQFLAKGRTVYVSGRVEMETWQGRDGEKTTLKVMVSDFRVLERREEAAAATASAEPGNSPEEPPF